MAPTCVAGPRDDHDETALAAPPFPLRRSMTAGRCRARRGKRELRPRLRERGGGDRRPRRSGEPRRGLARARRRCRGGAAQVALFWPLADEIDTLPLLTRCTGWVREPLLPRMDGRGRPLTFHRWRPGRAGRGAVPGAWSRRAGTAGRSCPTSSGAAARLRPPGHRLGYGAGFYDTDLRRPRRAEAASRFACGFCLRRPGARRCAGGRAPTYRSTESSPRPAIELCRAEAERVRILFVGDVVGRSGRASC